MDKWMFKIWLIGTLAISSCSIEPHAHNLFELVPEKTTGIDFVNVLSEADSFSIIDYIYYYNGAGVGAADFNQNGFEDLFFTANETSCRLYLNKGSFQFEDVTDEAGLNTDCWTTGVSIADVNGDGLLDIYISVAGHKESKKRSNKLYIHQGIDDNGVPSFKEMAKEMGVADTSHTTQAVFFDYNNDGWLDLYLLNHSNDREIVNTPLPIKSDILQPSNDRLYKNNGDGTFSDVTLQSGIIGAGYGLGVALGDFNKDGLLDIYVANDFIFSDQLWINQGDGTFSDQAKTFFSFQAYNSMGCDWSDIDNDGWEDLIVLDMLPEHLAEYKMMAGEMTWYKWSVMQNQGYMPQYMRNMLYHHNGVLAGEEGYTYNELGRYAGIAASDWSWAPLWLDINNNGLQDLFITNGYFRDITDQDFTEYNTNIIFFSDQDSSDRQLLNSVREQGGRRVANHIYTQEEHVQFLRHEEPSCPPSYSNGAIYADLDNDGYLDIVVSNINEPPFIMKNTTSRADSNNYLMVELTGSDANTCAIGAKVQVYMGPNTMTRWMTPVRGYQSSISQRLHFGTSTSQKVDSLIVTWPNRKITVLKNVEVNQCVSIAQEGTETEPYHNTERPIETHYTVIDSKGELEPIEREVVRRDFDREPLIPMNYSKPKPILKSADIFGTGVQSFIYWPGNGRDGYIVSIDDRENLIYSPLQNLDRDPSDFIIDDLDNDGHLDMIPIFSSRSDELSLENKNTTVYYHQEPDGTFNLKKWTSSTIPLQGFSSAVISQTENDTLLFLIGAIKKESYPLTYPNYLFKKQKGVWIDISDNAPSTLIDSKGVLQHVLWVHNEDFQKPALVTTGHWMKPVFYQWSSDELVETDYLEELEKGWWNHCAFWQDSSRNVYLFFANEGINTNIWAERYSPLSLYYGDLDRNGQQEAFLTGHKDGDNLPLYKRNTFIKKLHGFDLKFPRHKMYANASIEQMIQDTGSIDFVKMEANSFEHQLLSISQSGEVKCLKLPQYIQSSPINNSIYDAEENALYLLGNDYMKSMLIGYQAGWNIKTLQLDSMKVNADSKTGLLFQGAALSSSILSTAQEHTFMAVLAKETGWRVFKKNQILVEQ